MYEALIDTAGKQVTLRDQFQARPMMVRATSWWSPPPDEAPLYYLAWVQKNIDYVTKKTGWQGRLPAYPGHG